MLKYEYHIVLRLIFISSVDHKSNKNNITHKRLYVCVRCIARPPIILSSGLNVIPIHTSLADDHVHFAAKSDTTNYL